VRSLQYEIRLVVLELCNIQTEEMTEGHGKHVCVQSLLHMQGTMKNYTTEKLCKTHATLSFMKHKVSLLNIQG
jgi:hypothetical protein